MTLLITGASGFIGAAVARTLIAHGSSLRLLVRANSRRIDLPANSVEWIEGDLHDPASLDHAVAGCQGIFHLAADYRLWVPDPAAMYATNVRGTRLLMEAALKHHVERIVYTSTVATLGWSMDGTPVDETNPVTLDDMRGDYRRSKYLAEMQVRQMIRDQNLPAIIVHPAAPVGPDDHRPTPTGRLVRDAARGTLPGAVRSGFNIVGVDDVAMGHWLAYRNGEIGENYILGGDNIWMADFLSMIARLSGRRKPWLTIPRRLLYPLAFAAEWTAKWSGQAPIITRDALRLMKHPLFFTSDKACRALGYQPQPIESALKDAISWFGQNLPLDK